MMSPRSYWPYDELTTSRDSSSSFRFSTPWIQTVLEVGEADRERFAPLADRISTGTIGAGDLEDISWLLGSLQQYPLSYVLPASSESARDHHEASTPGAATASSPGELARQLGVPADLAARLPREWSWAADDALAFSRIGSGHDPISLFSVARRFHLLEAVEKNESAKLNEKVGGLSGPAAAEALALMVRQNHYVTERCDGALRPALLLAASAREALQEFLSAEAGHDKILRKALRAMGREPESVPVLPAVRGVMDLFTLAAGRNFLAFSLIVDMFERSSYENQDPLAKLLERHGFGEAARLIDAHREINDAGGHENVAQGFLLFMAPVGAEYAREALRLAELATHVMHFVSSDTLTALKGE